VPALIGALKDPEAAIRHSAMESLGEFGAEAKLATAALADWLGGADDDDRQYAAAALAKIGKPAVRVLVAALKTAKEEEVRLAAVGALETMGKDAEAAISALKDAQKDKSVSVREAAHKALERIQAP
jgi:HEAT repeat protein